MKKLLIILLVFSMLPTYAFADCDWSTGITPGPNKTFIYSEICHQQVGIMQQEDLDLQKALAAEKAATQSADTRADNWMNTSLKLESQFQKIDSMQKSNDEISFGSGFLAAVLLGFVVANLTHRN